MDYCIRYIDLPCTIKGLTALDSNGFYNIYINSRLSGYDQREAIKHELTHILRKDFDKEEEILEKVESM